MEELKIEPVVEDKPVYEGERQHFNNIRNIQAVDGWVIFEVGGKPGEGDKGRELESKVLSIRDAADRARSLNKMASRLPPKDREIALEIVDTVIAKCLEAREQVFKMDKGKVARALSGVAV